MTRVLLSQSQGAFATALTERLIAAGHDVVLAPEGAMVLVVTDLVDDLKVRAQIDPDAGSSITAEDLARLSDLIRSAAVANIPRIVLISAAEAPPGGAVGLPALVPAAAMKTAQQLETVLAEVAADRAVVLRTAEVIDPADSGFHSAVQALVEGGTQATWPFGPVVQGIALTDLLAATVAAVQVKGITGNWYDIVLPEAADRSSLMAEAQRIAHVLTDPDLTEIQERPVYPLPMAPRDGSAMAKVLRTAPRKNIWTLLAEALQLMLRAGVAAGKIAPLLPPMPEIHRALETGALPLAGKVAVLTGATAGIGRAMVPMLVRLGAEVVGIGRNAAAGEALAAEMAAALPDVIHRQARLARQEALRSGQPAPQGAPGPFHFEQADLSDLEQLTAVATRLLARYPRIDILINNAGAVFQERTETPKGIESTLAVNLIAPVTLTRLLAAPLKAAGATGWAKVINVASDAHFNAAIEVTDLQCRFNYSPINAYGRAKSGLVMLTRAFAEQMAPLGISIVAVSPGAVRTEILNDLAKPLTGGPTAQQRQKAMRDRTRSQMMTPSQGAAHVVDVLVSPSFATLNGAYISTDQVVPAAPHTDDLAQTKALWSAVAKLAGLPA